LGTNPFITYNVHTNYVRSLAICPKNENLICSVADDGNLIVLDTRAPFDPVFLRNARCKKF